MGGEDDREIRGHSIAGQVGVPGSVECDGISRIITSTAKVGGENKRRTVW